MRILVVDDNRDGADSQARLLELWGYDVRVAYDGMSGFALACEFRPDVMLIDIVMPGVDGLELARKIRADTRCVRAALFAMTGWSDAEMRQQAFQAGFDDYFIKPADPALLLDRLFHCPSTRLTPVGPPVGLRRAGDEPNPVQCNPECAVRRRGDQP